MNNYEKKLRKILIIEIIVFTIIIISEIIIITILRANTDFIKSYQHNKKIIYLDDEYVYYDNKKYKNEKNVVWIGDNSYIYYDKDFYFLNDDQENIKLFSKSIPIINFTIFYNNNTVYFKNINGFFKYDINKNLIEQIEKDYYYKIRDDDLYIIDSSKIDSATLHIKKNDEDIKKTVNLDLLKTNECFKKLYKNSIFQRIDSYLVCNQKIYILCSFEKHLLTLEYDFQTENIIYYDWYDIETASIHSFFIYNLDYNHPIFNAFNN